MYFVIITGFAFLIIMVRYNVVYKFIKIQAHKNGKTLYYNNIPIEKKNTKVVYI